LDQVALILEKIKAGNFISSEYILYSKLVFLLYFAVNKVDYFNSLPKLHQEYKKSLKNSRIIIIYDLFIKQGLTEEDLGGPIYGSLENF